MTLNGQDLGDALKSPFQDKEWFVKLGLQGALLVFFSFFLIGVPFLSGFMVALTRRSINNEPNLPNWTWGQYFVDGIKMIGVGIAYMAPLLAAWFVVLVLFVISIILSTQDDVFAIFTAITGVMMFVLYVVSFIYQLIMIFVQPAYIPLVALGAPFKASFQLKVYIWPYIKANIANILLGFLFGYLAGMIAAVGMLFLFVGYFFTLPYALAVMAHVHGLVYRRSVIQYKNS